MSKSLVQVSKFLSLILRHKPELIGMRLDPEGWLEINELIAKANAHGNRISLEELHEVVSTSDKQRFALSDDGLRIRANQGHSLAGVELNLDAVAPPKLLYHGTIEQFLPGIRSQGLLKRSRNHVHLSADEATAIKVAERRGNPVVLEIEALDMSQKGFPFFLSANGVWLTESVPVAFIKNLTQIPAD